jgi:hypothetical protein
MIMMLMLPAYMHLHCMTGRTDTSTKSTLHAVIFNVPRFYVVDHSQARLGGVVTPVAQPYSLGAS